MSAGGFCKLPNGSVVVALTVPSPSPGDGAVRVLVHAANRARALTRLRNLGLRAIYLRGNAEPPRPTRSQRSCTTRTVCSGEPPPLHGGRTVAPDQNAHETETPRPGKPSSRPSGSGSSGSSGFSGFSGSAFRGHSGHSSPSGV